MPQLLIQLLKRAVLMAPEGEAGGGGGLSETQLSELAEHGITSQEEFDALSEADRKALIAETPDDNHPVTDDEAAATLARQEAEAARKVEDDARAAAAAATKPEPTAAPVATQPPEGTPTATQAPVATQAPQWRAVTQPDPLGLELPNIIAPPVLVTQEDKTKLADTRTKLDALADQFTDGEITADDFKAQKRVLEDTLADLSGRQSAQIGLDAQHHQAVVAAFNDAVAATFAQAKAQGVDLTAPEHKDTLADLDAAIKRFGQAAPLMHPNQSMVWRDRWALSQAYKEVGEKRGLKLDFSSKTAPGAVVTEPAKQTPAQRAAPDLSAMPPTTRGAPNAADAHIQADEFSYLDNLTPSEAERIVAGFDDAKSARYLAR